MISVTLLYTGWTAESQEKLYSANAGKIQNGVHGV